MIPNKCLFDEVSVDDVTCPNIVGDGRYKVNSFMKSRLKAAVQEAFWTEAIEEIAAVDREYDVLMSDEDEVFDEDGDQNGMSEADRYEMADEEGDDEEEEEVLVGDALDDAENKRLSAHR